MRQYIPNLLGVFLAASFAAIIFPCQAQVIKESQSENTNNSIPLSSKTTEQSNLSEGNSTDSKPAVISDSTNNNTSDNAGVATNPNPRIPISSRIFAVPSMQQ